MFLYDSIDGITMLILAWYVPPPYSSEVITAGLAYMAMYPTVPAVWMGDINMTMNPSLDRPIQQGTRDIGSREPRLSRMLTEFALVDVWRYQHPNTRAYTCHSTSHGTMSRLDFILVSKTLLPKIMGLGFAPRA